MAYEYKRRKPSIIRNFWVYRRLIGTAVLLGLMLWFIWANDAQVTVAFPFGLGKLTSTTGVVILLSALVGSLATILVTTLFFAIRRIRNPQSPHDPPNPTEPSQTDLLPTMPRKPRKGFPTLTGQIDEDRTREPGRRLSGSKPGGISSCARQQRLIPLPPRMNRGSIAYPPRSQLPARCGSELSAPF